MAGFSNPFYSAIDSIPVDSHDAVRRPQRKPLTPNEWDEFYIWSRISLSKAELELAAEASFSPLYWAKQKLILMKRGEVRRTLRFMLVELLDYLKPA